MELKYYILIATILCGIIALLEIIIICWLAKKDVDKYPMPEDFTNEDLNQYNKAHKEAKEMSELVDINIKLSLLWRKFQKIEDHPIFDKKYLDECIEKATPNLSKIKDVDETLDEIRGDYDLNKKVDENMKSVSLRIKLDKIKDEKKL